MRKYETYKQQYTAAHAMMGVIAVIFGGMGAYHIVDALGAMEKLAAFRTNHADLGMVVCLLLFPLPLWLEWRCRKQQFPSKRMLWAMAILAGLSVMVASEASRYVYRPYFKQHGYTLCAKYTSGQKHAKRWEVWAPKGQCPANPRAI